MHSGQNSQLAYIPIKRYNTNMLKEYLKNQGISVYALSKKIDIAYSTLNDLSNGKVDINNCRLGFIKALADELNLSIDDLYEICNNTNEIKIDSCEEPVKITAKNKKYYAGFIYNGEPVEIQLGRVNEDSSLFLYDLAEWRVNGYIRKKKFEEAEKKWNTL